jgi:uncharacterized membrane protein YqjE
MRTTGTTPTQVAGEDPTLGALVHQLSEQTSKLVRSEVELAKAELTQKGKEAGVGIGLFSAAGLLGFFGGAVLIATAILALALVLPAWASALIIGVVLLAGAGVAALMGKNKVAEGAPPKPERAMEGVREDIATIKGGHA